MNIHISSSAFLRKFVPYCDRKDVSVLWKYGDSDGDAGTRCDYQYYFRSDHDIRLFRIPGTRGKRSGDRNGDGQFAACICSVILFVARCKEIKIRFKGFRLDKTIVSQLYVVAIPSTIMMSLPLF